MSLKRKRDSEIKTVGLPQHWQRCPNKAISVIAEKFVVFKCPIQESKFEVELMGFSSEGTPGTAVEVKIGLWIDLTDQSRQYYDTEDVRNLKAKYVNIPCSKDESPDTYKVNHFIKICSEFLKQNPNGLIGVHGLYGFNRTGFMENTFN